MSMKIRPIILNSEQKNRLEDLEEILFKYKEILGLENENIEVGISAKSNAFLHWYEEKKTWGIYLIPTDNHFTPIHELGHIYLAKKTNYPYFARSGIRSHKIFEGLRLIVNHLVDCFVDYNLIQLEGLYKLYVEDAHIWRDAKKKGKIKGKPIDLVHSYKTIIGYYLSLKIIDKENDRRNFIDIKNYLKNAKQLIKTSFPNKRFNFQSLEQQLDFFDEIKDTKDAKMIIKFFYSILYEISLWKENEIQKQMKLLFPNL